MTRGGESDDALLEHMRECIVRVQEYTKDGRDVFFEDEKTQDAVIRKLQTLAQSSIKLSNEAKAGEKELPWRKLKGFRNIVVHQYADVSLSIVWDIVENHLHQLLDGIGRLRPERDWGHGR